MEPVTARFVWTVDELAQAQRIHAQHQCRSSLQSVVYLLLWLMPIGGAIGLITGTTTDRVVCWALLFGGLAIIFMRPIAIRFVRHYRFNRRPDKNKKIEWRFAPEVIHVQTDTAKSEFGWEVFSKIVRSKQGILFYPNDQIFHWVPRNGFQDNPDFEKVTELSTPDCSISKIRSSAVAIEARGLL